MSSPRERLAGEIISEQRQQKFDTRFSSLRDSIPILIGAGAILVAFIYHMANVELPPWDALIDKSDKTLTELLDPIFEEAFVRELLTRYPNASDESVNLVLEMRRQRIAHDKSLLINQLREEQRQELSLGPDVNHSKFVRQSHVLRQIPTYKSSFNAKFLAEISDLRIMRQRPR